MSYYYFYQVCQYLFIVIVNYFITIITLMPGSIMGGIILPGLIYVYL